MLINAIFFFNQLTFSPSKYRLRLDLSKSIFIKKKPGTYHLMMATGFPIFIQWNKYKYVYNYYYHIINFYTFLFGFIINQLIKNNQDFCLYQMTGIFIWNTKKKKTKSVPIR